MFSFLTTSHYSLPRVHNKVEKRVLNALYALSKMLSESHVPGIQTLTNENA